MQHVNKKLTLEHFRHFKKCAKLDSFWQMVQLGTLLTLAGVAES